MKKSIATKTNLSLFFALILLNILALFLVPTLLHNNMWWCLLLIPALLFSNTYWALMHEGIHYSLFLNKNHNDYLSRILGIFFGCAFNVVRAGHLLHHRMNRSEHDRMEVFEPDKQKWLPKTLYYYWFLMNGLYQTEILLPFISFLPKSLIMKKLKNLSHDKAHPESIEYFINQLNKPKVLNQIRIDTIGVLIAYAISFFLYGHYWFILVLFLLVRGFLISMADNLPHYNTPVDDKRFAYNLVAPRLLQWLLLNFNYHRIHHHYPNIPWHELPKTFLKHDNVARYSYAKQWLNQFKGLIHIDEIKKIKID